jgi:hypothetical protein
VTWALWRIMFGGGAGIVVAMAVANLVLFGTIAR